MLKEKNNKDGKRPSKLTGNYSNHKHHFYYFFDNDFRTTMVRLKEIKAQTSNEQGEIMREDMNIL